MTSAHRHAPPSPANPSSTTYTHAADTHTIEPPRVALSLPSHPTPPTAIPSRSNPPSAPSWLTENDCALLPPAPVHAQHQLLGHCRAPRIKCTLVADFVHRLSSCYHPVWSAMPYWLSRPVDCRMACHLVQLGCPYRLFCFRSVSIHFGFFHFFYSLAF